MLWSWTHSIRVSGFPSSFVGVFSYPFKVFLTWYLYIFWHPLFHLRASLPLFSGFCTSFLRGLPFCLFFVCRMSNPPFTAADFAKWNSTTSCFRIPKHLVSKESVKQVRVVLIQAFGASKVSAIQPLQNCQYRVEFSSPSYKIAYNINGLNFRGVYINPTPAYELVTRVFVDRAQLRMPDTYLSSALAPYGRVIGVQHLTVRGYNNIRTGTHMVSMALEKPIPSELTIASFSCSVKYQGQPHKHTDPAPTHQDSGLPNTAPEATTTLPKAAAGELRVQTVNVLGRPVDVGASTSRDYVDPLLTTPPSHTVMDTVEPAAMEDSSSPVLDTTIVAGMVTISLTEFKSSSPAGGEYSYMRHVSVKRLTKKERCAERVIARGVARSRRWARLAEVHARAARRTTAPSNNSGVRFSPPVSPVVTENRFVVLQDENHASTVLLPDRHDLGTRVAGAEHSGLLLPSFLPL